MGSFARRLSNLEGRKRGIGLRRRVVSQLYNETEEEALARYRKNNQVRPEDEVTYLYGAWINVDRGNP